MGNNDTRLSGFIIYYRYHIKHNFRNNDGSVYYTFWRVIQILNSFEKNPFNSFIPSIPWVFYCPDSM